MLFLFPYKGYSTITHDDEKCEYSVWCDKLVFCESLLQFFFSDSFLKIHFTFVQLPEVF